MRQCVSWNCGKMIIGIASGRRFGRRGWCNDSDYGFLGFILIIIVLKIKCLQSSQARILKGKRLLTTRAACRLHFAKGNYTSTCGLLGKNAKTSRLSVKGGFT